jgi:hypothetical protein
MKIANKVNSKKFIDDIIEISKKHGLSLGHEDHHGAFEVETYDEGNIEWLKQCLDFMDD